MNGVFVTFSLISPNYLIKIPSPDNQAARAVGERGRSVRSHHNWGTRFGRRRGEVKTTHKQPKNLYELEELARRAVELMESHAPKSEHNHPMVMDLLRQQYNLNFMIICDRCRGLHAHHDEIMAPER